MKGQWIGRTSGGQVGLVIVNVDDRGGYFSGNAFTFPDDKSFAPSGISFETKDKGKDFNFISSIIPINPETGLSLTWEEIEKRHPGIPHSKKIEVSGHFEENDLFLKGQTDLGVKLESRITKKPFSEWSDLVGEIKTWDNYKEHVATFSEGGYLFRGQAKPWKLRTAFHRRRRYDLWRFLNEDIPKLHLRLTGRTKHFFNFENPQEYGAFLNLGQHHGFPTPLLDWTFSPYTAAFFAFRNVPRKMTGNEFARVFVFNQKKWSPVPSNLVNLFNVRPFFSVMELLAIDNDRVIPQQAATIVTNIDDIEEFIRQVEDLNRERYLMAINIPWSERDKVIKELSYMGITAGSMFPGLDGACEELREKQFAE